MKGSTITELRVWQKSIRDHVRIYRDGLIKLDGCFGNSVTFISLGLPENQIRSITKSNGMLKSSFIRKLSKFMAKNRPKSNLDNRELIICGIIKLLSEDSS